MIPLPIRRGLGLCVLTLGLFPTAAGAQGIVFAGGRRLGPDQLQTLGVGSRSISMGNAFSAIADDASATFWNPGRLGFLPRREFMLEYRPVFNTDSHQTFGALNANGTFASPNPQSFSSGNQPGHPQLGFASFTYNLAKNQTLGVSYTLGGYLNYTGTVDRLSLTDATGAFVKENGTSNLRVSNSYVTIAYGFLKDLETKKKRASKKTDAAGKPSAGAGGKSDQESVNQYQGNLGFGIGVFFLNQEYRSSSSVTQSYFTANGGSDPNRPTVANPPTTINERGHGIGVNLGLSYYSSQHYRLGLSYRSRTVISGLDKGELFNNETPDRLALGFAYDFNDNHPDKNQLIVSTEFEALSAVNRKLVQGIGQEIDRRRAVGNFHIGAEYTLIHKSYSVPLRVGFRTNSAAATNYTFYDNVVSFGFALQSRYGRSEDTSALAGLRYSIEPAVEIFTSNGSTQFTITGRARF